MRGQNGNRNAFVHGGVGDVLRNGGNINGGMRGRGNIVIKNNNDIRRYMTQQQPTRSAFRPAGGVTRNNCGTRYEGVLKGVRSGNRPQFHHQGTREEDFARDQRRAARWRILQTTIVAKNMRQFKEGADQFLQELIPTHSQIVAGMDKSKVVNDEAGKDDHHMNYEARDRYKGHTCEDSTIRELIEQWQGGGHGYVPEKKNDNIIRLACENVNSLSLHQKGGRKTRKLVNLVSRYQADGMCIVEHGMNYGHAESKGNYGKDGVFASINGSRNSAGYNKHENHSRYMTGGTMVSTFTRLSSFVIAQGVDRTGLGRWSWILMGSGDHRTIIVSAYQPQHSTNKPRLITSEGSMIRGGTVAAQHRRYFRQRGNCRNPRDIFTAQLVTQLKAWRAKGYEIILFADLNENVYTGRFSQLLQHQSLLMEEQTLKSTA